MLNEFHSIIDITSGEEVIHAKCEIPKREHEPKPKNPLG